MLGQWIRRRELAAFLVVAFGWTWTWDLLFALFGLWERLPVTFPRQWGLPVAAVVVVRASDGSLRDWAGRALRLRLRPALYAIAVLVPLGVSAAQQVVRAVGGGSLAFAPPAGPVAVVVFVLANAVLLGGVEEVGWRGFLQPRLQQRTSVLTAGLGVGVLWWSWHLPLFVSGDPSYSLEPLALLSYTTFVLGASTVFGAFVNATGGSVVPVMVMHATTNLGPLLAGSGGAFADSRLVGLVVGSGLWWAIVVVLVARNGRQMVQGSTVEPLA